MSERMTPIPFSTLLDWIITEYERDGSVFGVARPYHAVGKTLPIFGERIETPFGPAAGPNTQLAQNIIASYFAGARFFELKTVQKMDGAELAACISRPCITAADECYNCEWSTELTVQEAFSEYVKAWCVLKLLAHRYHLGNPDGFVFNMSVGYDLAGIQTEKIDRFIEGMKDATETAVFSECLRTLAEKFPEAVEFIHTISPHISRSVTLSTLHGCPPQEIESIASYLLEKKRVHTFVKCNPTLLGYESARAILDSMGYDYVTFGRFHFEDDLQFSDAIPMFRRLQALAAKNSLEFGLKLSNTFPVDVTRGELPSEEMYMAGKALFPLTIEMVSRISHEFDGRLRISYSGGADAFNVNKLFSSNIFPITMATTALKPGGYQRFLQIAEMLDKQEYRPFERVDQAAISELSLQIRTDRHHVKALKPLPRRKLAARVPLMDCFIAPCQGGCPISQDIPAYLELLRQGRDLDALRLIMTRNPLPFITGTICAHPCMEQCTRNYYDSPVNIRTEKLRAAQAAFPQLLSELTPAAPCADGRRVAIVGGGPAGMAAAFFTARAGIPTTIFERENALGGIVRQVIPSFRIPDEAIERDEALLRKLGVDIRLNTPAPTVTALRSEGYTHILLAVGAWKSAPLPCPGNGKPVISWMKDEKAGRHAPLGHVAVVGGGNTAMDAARLALASGATSATLVYRRTKKYMPADEEELKAALSDGVRMVELVSPIRQQDGRLLLQTMALTDYDFSGRRGVIGTDETLEIPCDTIISAVGEQVDPTIFLQNSIERSASGKPAFQTNLPGVYAAGDCLRGPSTVVSAIADAQAFADAVIGRANSPTLPENALPDCKKAVSRKGVLTESGVCEGERCLACSVVCQVCADVCPNRANVVITLPDGRLEILHVDRMCNECGNCLTFCPYDSAPYRDKLTLFATAADFNDSENQGFLPLGGKRVLVRLDGGTMEVNLSGENALPHDLAQLILAVLSEHAYLLS